VKVTLDLGRLLQEGRITHEEYARLESLAARATASLALNPLPLRYSSRASVALGIALGLVQYNRTRAPGLP
jgi:hypothetical protein